MDTQQITPQQAYTNRVYHALIEEHGIRLNREQYSFHLGHFARILQRDDATHSEAIAAGDRIVERLPYYRKIDASKALQDVRTRAARGEKPPTTIDIDEYGQISEAEVVNWDVLARASKRAFEGWDDEELARQADLGDEWAQYERSQRESRDA